MKGTFSLFVIAFVLISIPINSLAIDREDWNLDVGFHFFKHSASGIPNELNYNPVFHRWEMKQQNLSSDALLEYSPLEPLYFNMNFGMDFFVRYRNFLLVKVGYDYSNPFGIGGKGEISYIESGHTLGECKEFSYTSHQITTFIGPIMPIGSDWGEIYLGFSPMAPTWVEYKEKFNRKFDGEAYNDYEKTFTGFFGSCRGLIGMQVKVGEKISLGSEVVFAFLNYMQLESDDGIKDNSFQFPEMLWSVTFRYNLF